MNIRKVQTPDYQAITMLIKQTYPPELQTDKLQLLKTLRKSYCYMPTLEVIGEINGKICAHGMLSEATINQKLGLVLSFLEVQPQFQRNGFGTQIVDNLLQRAQASGYRFIAVQGSAHFFAKFNFIPIDPSVVCLPQTKTTDCFLVKELVSEALFDIKGTLIYD